MLNACVGRKFATSVCNQRIHSKNAFSFPHFSSFFSIPSRYTHTIYTLLQQCNISLNLSAETKFNVLKLSVIVRFIYNKHYCNIVHYAVT